jgi:hypothetical protein
MNTPKGWECPKCGKVHAPWVAECDCYKQVSKDVVTFPRPFHPPLMTGDPIPPLLTQTGDPLPDPLYRTIS